MPRDSQTSVLQQGSVVPFTDFVHVPLFPIL